MGGGGSKACLSREAIAIEHTTLNRILMHDCQATDQQADHQSDRLITNAQISIL